ncbi:MAG: site-specific DNA-methyltransferase [Phycisphaerales bacterium]|nr:site-specific DNA-methyltransferase [Phycisphaerales bacterium]
MSMFELTPDTIYCGDSIELLNAAPAGSVDLVFADPPFNIGYVYDRYNDDRPDAEYVLWTRDWMAACVRILKSTGSFYIAIGDEFAADIRVLGRELGLHLRNWIIWHYTFGQSAKTKFARGHTHIFYFTKDRTEFTFNDHLLRFPSARHTEYQDLRANPLGRLPDDVWTEFPRVCGTFKERAGFHGCQMPEALLMRIVSASSNPGEVVLDPFIGSGTTAAAAKRLGRRYVGIDLSPEYAAHVRARLEPLRNELGARPVDGVWPALHEEMLLQLYRETGVALHNLLPNLVALKVIATSLSARAGTTYTAEAVRERLEALGKTKVMPKLPNDLPFVARRHAKQEGKRYERRILRQTTRRRSQAGDAPPGESRQRAI